MDIRNHTFNKTKGIFITPPYAGVAGAASDNVKLTSAAIDRSGFSELDLYSVLSATVAALTEAKGIEVTVKILDSEDGTNFADFSSITFNHAAITVNETLNKIDGFKVDLQGAGQFLKFEVTADSKATGTDTYNYAVNGILACAQSAPTVNVSGTVEYL